MAPFPALARSMRLRIALLSALLSGLVLAAFGVWAWAAVERIGLDRIDQDIREIAHRHLSGSQGQRHWTNVEESLRFVLGPEEERPFILLVKDRRDKVLHQSPDWPAELPADTFPSPADLRFDPLPQPPPGDYPGDRPENRFRPNQPPLPGDDPRPGPPQNRAGRPQAPPPPRLPITTHRFVNVASNGQTWRIGAMSNPEVTFVLGLNTRRLTGEMRSLLAAFLIPIPIALVLIAAGGWYVARRALHPVRTLTEAAETITAQGLDRRIAVSTEDAEFERLILVFNLMLDRLERSFHQAVRFSADAAHELKTPLTILQGELEQALQAAPTGSPQQQTLNTLLEEVQRLKAVVRKLLLLALADSGELRPHMEPLDLTELVEESIEDIEVLAPELGVEKELVPGVAVTGDRDLVRQVLQNMVSNAIKYNHPGGRIRLILRRKAGMVRLSVANTGAGIPPEDRARVFERFYRADKARNRRVDGIGLGLSLAREIARAHQGRLFLEDATGDWTVFTLELPESRPTAT